MMAITRLGMVDCIVESHFGAYVVSFPDESSILLQSDTDQAAFAVSCGLVKAPKNWDGSPSKLGKAWKDCDLEDIHECPDEYLALAE